MDIAKKKPPISLRFIMCSVTVLLTPPIIQSCSNTKSSCDLNLNSVHL